MVPVSSPDRRRPPPHSKRVSRAAIFRFACRCARALSRVDGARELARQIPGGMVRGGVSRTTRASFVAERQGNTQWSLSQMGQVPFYPPNVGGWPYGQAWLSGVSFQYRFGLAQGIVTAGGDLSPLSVAKSKMVQACADWLGVPEWSRRTGSVLSAATGSPSELAIAAVLSPEYMVSA